VGVDAGVMPEGTIGVLVEIAQNNHAAPWCNNEPNAEGHLVGFWT
tara:strand:+ start:1408 stop:1542 length:135 start_codon:yes stop_codon:yes gene_type:complete